MIKIFVSLLISLAFASSAQARALSVLYDSDSTTKSSNIEGSDILEQLKADPRKSYGTDYPYGFEETTLTKSPKGYKPFYISHYARHGSRYYWSKDLYKDIDAQLSEAHEKHLLTAEGELFYSRFKDVLPELMAGWGELTDAGWNQHQDIARTMYNRFPEVFAKGGSVSAISSLSGRCVISMSAFCQELAQCNPKLEITEKSSRSTLHGVVPTDKENPYYKEYPKMKPRYEQSKNRPTFDPTMFSRIVGRVLTSTDSLSFKTYRFVENLKNLYTSLPSIGHVGMMGNIYTDEDMVSQWEASNLGSYSWVFGPQKDMIPILEDIIQRANDVIEGKSKDVASLRFGHDTCIGPLTVLLGINGADKDPEDPFEVKNIYQNWQTCKASNIQLVFYRGKSNDDILVKCLLNGSEAMLPVPTTQTPYYRWSDFCKYYAEKCK